MPFCGFRSAATGTLFAVCIAVAGTEGAFAQSQTRGFNLTIPATQDSAELTLQPDLWSMEVSFKPMRMIRVEVTDPITKKKKSELVWYLVWRAVNRTLERPADESPFTPVNEKEPVARPFFVPEFTLVTDDNGVQTIYPDMIIPEAQAAISAREKMNLKNSVELTQLLPEAVPEGETPKTELEGVAMWKGIDPKTDYFTVFATGFASPYKVTKGPDGKPIVWRKTIIQEFWRPSDHIDERETEIRRLDELQPSTKDQHSPRWIYRADAEASQHPEDIEPLEGEAAENPEEMEAPAGDAQPAAEEGAQPAPEAESAPKAEAEPAPN